MDHNIIRSCRAALIAGATALVGIDLRYIAAIGVRGAPMV
jgi:hypothetical protein